MNFKPARTPLTAIARALTLCLAAATTATALSGCAALLIGGAVVGGTMMAIDRRTSGTQVEDQGIELKALARVRELALPAHITVTSYNRMALITGEVPRDADRQAVQQAIERIENVRGVFNELAVGAPSSVSSRTNDSILSGKVKASFVDAKDLQAPAAKVVTERGIVYLMGRVTPREANRFADVARSVSGVQKVVKVFEEISEAELAALIPPR